MYSKTDFGFFFSVSNLARRKKERARREVIAQRGSTVTDMNKLRGSEAKKAKTQNYEFLLVNKPVLSKYFFPEPEDHLKKFKILFYLIFDRRTKFNCIF